MAGLKSNFVCSLLATTSNAVVGLVSIPFITRHVSAADFGHISLLLLVFYLFNFLDGLLPVIINFRHARNYDNADFLKTCQMFSWMMGAAAFSLTLILLLLIYRHVFSLVEIFLMAICAMLFFPTTAEAAFLESRQRVGFAMLVRSGGWAFVYLSFIVYVIVDCTFEWFAFSLTLMSGSLLVVYRAANTSEPRNGKLEYSIIKDMLLEIKKVLLFNFYVAVTNFSDRLFLSKLLPLDRLGFYSAQYELGTKAYVLPYMVSKVLYPNFSERLSGKNPQAVLSDWKHITKWVFFTMFSISLIAFYFSEVIIKIYAGQAYAEHSYVFKIVMIGIAMNSIGFMSILLQRAKGDFSSQEKAYFFGSAMGIIAVYPMVKIWGLWGAAMVYLIMRSSDLILAVQTAKMFQAGHQPWKTYVVWPISVAACYLFMQFEFYSGFTLSFIVFSVTLFTRNDIKFFKKGVFNAYRK